jgi:hypothetical protein
MLLLDVIFGRIIINWPEADSLLYYDWVHACTNRELFWMVTVQPTLIKMRTEFLGSCYGKSAWFNDDVGKEIELLLKKVRFSVCIAGLNIY